MSGLLTADRDVRRLNSPGPIADRFLLSRAFLKVIVGCVGSGKTITALRALRRVATRQGGQMASDGVIRRKARVGVIRESYPNIEKNTLPSWFRIHPESDGKFTWKQPFTHKITLILKEDASGRPTDICEFEIEFRAIGDKTVEEACRGWEVVAVLIDEADLQPAELVAYLSGRVGRSSDLNPALVVDQQIILALNAPYMDNWVYALAIERNLEEIFDPKLLEVLGDRPLIETFIQPGGRDPRAENLHNLPPGYYELQAALNKHRPDYVARMIDNKFVPMQFGQPVNPQFDFATHVRKVEWDRRRKLIVGFDQGLFCAAVASQRLPMGEFRTLAEAVMMVPSGGGTLLKIGPSAAGHMVRTMINDHFPELEPDMLRIVGDPAAWNANDREDNELDWMRAFRKALGHPVYKAKTNRASLRNEAIWHALATRDGYAVDPSCKHLIRGHLGGYRYAKADMKDGELRGHLEIADTIYTHVCDAEQYAAVEGEHVIADIRGVPRLTAPIVNDSDFDVFRGRG